MEMPLPQTQLQPQPKGQDQPHRTQMLPRKTDKAKTLQR